MPCQKLASLLKLPQSLTLLKARISLIRLTVPADLYKSGILVEFEGVDIRVETTLEGKQKGESTNSKRRNQNSSKGVEADRARSTQSLIHDPGGIRPHLSSNNESDGASENGDISEELPTTENLAQSFLQAELRSERKGLQAAIAQSHSFEESSSLSDSEDDSSSLGVGNALSLPGFLADFLKGVKDRLQLKVKNVSLDIDLDLDMPLDPSTGNIATDVSETVTIRLSIGNVDLQGINNSGPEQHLPSREACPISKPPDGSSQTLRPGFRCVSMDKIHVMLVSDASLFANISRYFTPASPAATNMSSHRRTDSQQLASSQSTSAASSTTHGPTHSTKMKIRDQPIHVSPEIEASPASCDIDRYSETGYDDTGKELGPMSASSLGESRYQDSLLADSFYSNSGAEDLEGRISEQHDQPSVSFTADTTEHKNEGKGPQVVPKRPEEGFRIALDDPENLRLRSERGSSLFPSSAKGFIAPFDPIRDANPGHGSPQHTQGDHSSTHLRKSQYFLHSSDHEEDTIYAPSEDLTQSKIYTHEEAESMYMSAISHVSSQHTKDSIFVPGESDSSSPENEKISVASNDELGIHPIDIDLKLPQPSIGSLGFADFQSPQGDEDIFTAKHNQDRPISLHSSNSSPTAVQSKSNINSHDLQSGDFLSQDSDSQNSSARSENPLIIMKRFISIDSIILQVPQTLEGISENHGQRSVRVETLSDQSATSPFPLDSADKSSQNFVTTKKIHRGETPQNTEETEEPVGQPALLNVGNMEILGDVGLTKLAILIIQQNLQLLQSKHANDTGSGAVEPPLAHVKLRVNKISWNFLDLVKGFSSSNGKAQDIIHGPGSFNTNAEVLLKASVDKLDIAIRKNESSTKTVLSMGKFSFGYLSENIISFNSGLKMRESTRDILAPVDNDLILTITQTTASSKIDLTTLPLHIVLDLRRLDETSSWFGGYSSILGLGSSMMSTVTTVNTRPGPSQPPKPSRGVHFETAAPSKPSQGSQTPVRKITTRIGGFVMILQGAHSSLCLESTAMKLVSRAEGIGLQVDKMKFTMPYLRHHVDEPSITANLANIRAEYLSTPKEVDLARLLALLSPSKDKYERDDDILLDTLLLQRRQGGVVRLTIETLESHISNLEHLRLLPEMAEELKKLSTVAKYLPADDRPGILTLGLIRDLQCSVTAGTSVGVFSLRSKKVEVAHVTLPSLTALGIDFIQIHRNDTEELLGGALPYAQGQERLLPTIMARFLGNEMEPVVKVKIQNLRTEYHVPTILALMGVTEDSTTETIISGMVSSIATVTAPQQFERLKPKLSSQASSQSDKSSSSSKFMRIDISIRDSIVGLNPHNFPAKGLIVLTDARVDGTLPKEDEANATFEIKKASLMVIDDQKNIISGNNSTRSNIRDSQKNQKDQSQQLLDSGFVSVSYISSAKVSLKSFKLGSDSSRCLDIEIRDDLVVLESCADSTQTLLAILNGLKPPMPPSTEVQYRTQIVPVEDMLASLSGDAYAAPPDSEGMHYTAPLDLDEGDMVNDEVPENLEFVSSFYNPDPANFQGLANSMLDDDLESLASPPATGEIGEKILLESFQEQYQIAPGNSSLDFRENHFGASSMVGGTAHRWDTKQNTYDLTNELKISGSPLRLRVRDVHIIWNLFDGYDWQHTRDAIDKAVAEVEIKAAERFSQQDRRKSPEAEEEEESVIGDFLFNSIYIGIPANRDPKELARQVSHNLDGLASETESHTTSSASGSPNRQGQMPRARGRRLRLHRSKYHKMTFELQGLSADVIIFPPDAEETQSSVDIRVQDLEIFDHLPSSTWKKFATYMHEAGERESGTSMVHLEILNVKPVPNLAASEIILKVR